MRFMLFAGASALIATAGAAHAGTQIGWYVAADAGVHQPSTQHLSVSDISLYSRDFDASSGADLPDDPVLGGATGPYSLKPKDDVALFGRLGYRFAPHWRAELELGNRPGEIKHSILDGNDSESGAAGRGHVNLDSTLINILYDFAPDAKVNPFIGLGVGNVRVKTKYRGEFVPTQTTGDPYDITTTYKINKKTFNTAWQFVAGVSWALSDRLDLDLTYRYLDAGKMHYDITADSTYNVDVSDDCDEEDDCCFEETACTPPPPNPEGRAAPRLGANAQTINTVPVAETDIISASSSRLHDHSLTLGLRWSFAAPPPPAPPVEAAAPPPPPPAPAVPPPPQVVESYGPQQNAPAPQSFTVYFAFDRSNLTDTAMQVINSAAAYAKTGSSPRVLVTGHTDTAGSNAYNVALSMKRAQAVADGLVADGVDSGAIKTGWTGEKDLAVPTPNGTPNPENRRTTIDIAF